MKATHRRSAPLLPILVGLCAPAFADTPSSCPHGPRDASAAGVVEVTSFRFARGLDEADRARAVDASTDFLCARSGFLGRRLLTDDAGSIDLVYWADADAARAAFTAAGTDAAMAPFLEAIDPDSIAVREAVTERWVR